MRYRDRDRRVCILTRRSDLPDLEGSPPHDGGCGRAIEEEEYRYCEALLSLLRWPKWHAAGPLMTRSRWTLGV